MARDAGPRQHLGVTEFNEAEHPRAGDGKFVTKAVTEQTAGTDALATDWRDALSIEVEADGDGWYALQFDGNDLVRVTDLDPDEGTARVTVYASTHECAEEAWTGRVDVMGHLDPATEREVIESISDVTDMGSAVDQLGRHALALQIHGHDLVGISGIDADTGAGVVTVWSSTRGDAYEAWRGQVSVRAHIDDSCQQCRGPLGEDGACPACALCEHYQAQFDDVPVCDVCNRTEAEAGPLAMRDALGGVLGCEGCAADGADAEQAAGTHVVTLDTRPVSPHMSEDEAYAWLLKHQGQSIDYATRYGGYAIQPVTA